MFLSSALFIIIFSLVQPVSAQRPHSHSGDPPWIFRVRAVASTASYESDPEGYKMYSGISMGAGIALRINAIAAVEIALRTEGRDLEGPVPVEGEYERLGSLDLIPLTVILQWKPRGQTHTVLQPYLGAGLSITATWEKSGAMEGVDVPPSFDPVVQAGADYELSTHMVLNLDIKWNTLTLDLENFRVPDPSVKIDPLTVGLGLGFRF